MGLLINQVVQLRTSTTKTVFNQDASSASGQTSQAADTLTTEGEIPQWPSMVCRDISSPASADFQSCLTEDHDTDFWLDKATQFHERVLFDSLTTLLPMIPAAWPGAPRTLAMVFAEFLMMMDDYWWRFWGWRSFVDVSICTRVMFGSRVEIRSVLICRSCDYHGSRLVCSVFLIVFLSFFRCSFAGSHSAACLSLFQLQDSWSFEMELPSACQCQVVGRASYQKSWLCTS